MIATKYYMVDISEILIRIENILSQIQYPENQHLRTMVRNYTVVKSLEEILLLENTPRIDYLDVPFQMIKNNYIVHRYGVTTGLLEDVSEKCLQRKFQSNHFDYSPAFEVRGRWLIGKVL